MSENEKLIDRVRKLLATADVASNASENERNVALKKAQQIMLVNGLCMADIGAYVKEYGGIGEETVVTGRPTWQGSLLHKMAPFFLCRMYELRTPGRGGTSRMYSVVGREYNRGALIAIWNYCCVQMTGMLNTELRRRDKRAQYARIAFEQWIEERGPFEAPKLDNGIDYTQLELAMPDLQSELEDMDGEDQLDLIIDLCQIARNYAAEVRPFIKRGEIAVEMVQHLGTWKRSFCKGMVHVVAEKVEAFYDDAVEKTPSKHGKEIVVQEQEALDKYLKDLELGEASYGGQADLGGLAAGAAAGAKVDVGDAAKKVARKGRKELT